MICAAAIPCEDLPGCDAFCARSVEQLVVILYPAQPFLGAALSELNSCQCPKYRRAVFDELVADGTAARLGATSFNLSCFIAWIKKRVDLWVMRVA